MVGNFKREKWLESWQRMDTSRTPSQTVGKLGIQLKKKTIDINHATIDERKLQKNKNTKNSFEHNRGLTRGRIKSNMF